MTAMYPTLRIDRNKAPNRLYAIPLLGFLVKAIAVIPVGIELALLSWARFIFSMLNACNIFFRGRYWKMAYQLNLGVMQLETNVAFFLWGLTDEYPGFSLQTTNYDITIELNKTPNRVLATPLLGMLFRFVLLIPYILYRQLVAVAAFVAVVVSWIFVLFAGTYPETTHEIVRDSVRIDQAANMYFLGMSDIYPSWWMSFHHKTLKIILLVVAALLVIMNFFGRWEFTPKQQPERTRILHTAEKTVIPSQQPTAY